MSKEFDVMTLFGKIEVDGKGYVPSDVHADLMDGYFDRREAIDALKNVMGVIDTPIGRRRLGIDSNDPPEWFREARVTVRKFQ